ncbi:MAG: tetratricopeptide repeat protein [Deltaproteobacteria bacterium]|nr:tetratricopeptide repeat protein [Deltaproteobacteria bacterium]
MRKSLFPVMLVALLAMQSARAEPSLNGEWKSVIGTIAIRDRGGEVTGKLRKPAANVPIKKGQQVLVGAVLEDNLTGELTVALSGPDCPSTAKAMVVLLVAPDSNSLSGAVHLPKLSCIIPGLSEGGGTRFTRVRAPPRPRPSTKGLPTGTGGSEGQPVTPGEQIPRGKEAIAERMNLGFRLLQDGQAEESRRAFLSVLKADPSRVEAYNGVGVTFWRRGRYDDALAWYKKALDVDPDFGDVYYNIACIYSLLGKKALAMRYLKIALLNDYLKNNTASELLDDDDLANIREEPEFKELLSTLPGGPPASAPASAPAPAPSPAR